jgi:hypothetical protein
MTSSDMAGQSAGIERFASKRDTWLGAIIWLACLVALLGPLTASADRASILALLLAVVFGAAAAVFLLWVFYGTYYLLTPAGLLIRCGPFRFRVPLREIDTVTPSTEAWSGPACSLDRIKIRWRDGRRAILISPAERQEFYRALLRRCPHLVQEGDGLVSRTRER